MNNKLSISALPDKHLSADIMYQYLHNELSAEERHEVERHLLDCNLCADALDGLSTSTKAQTERQLFEINYHLKTRAPHRHPNTMLQHLKNWGLTTAILFLVLLAALMVWYQVKKAAPGNTPHPAVTETTLTPAQPLNGLPAYQQYLQQNSRYPAKARQLGISGEVVLSFTVNPDSSLSNLRVVRGLTPELNAEALRLLKDGPVWVPAQRSGQPVTQNKTITIPFQLSK